MVHDTENRGVLAKSSTRPLVTVIVCVYNAGEYFRPSLASILNQTYEKLDIIVIDDGSTDGCIESASDLLRDSRVRLFRQANATKPVALNRALSESRGEFYAQQDADDISHPIRIEKQLAAMLGNPNLAAVYSGYELIIAGRAMAPLFAAKSEKECWKAITSFRMPAHDPTGMYRMSLVGGMRYEESLQGAEGLDYILRVGELHPMIVVGQCLYQYRILDTSITRRDPAGRQRKVDEAIRRARERRGLGEDKVELRDQLLRWRSKNAFKDNYIAAHFIESVRCQRAANSKLGALKTGLDCVRIHPLDLDYYRPLFFALAPSSVIRLIRRPPEEKHTALPRSSIDRRACD